MYDLVLWSNSPLTTENIPKWKVSSKADTMEGNSPNYYYYIIFIYLRHPLFQLRHPKHTPERQDGGLRFQVSNLRCRAAFQRSQLKGDKNCVLYKLLHSLQHIVSLHSLCKMCACVANVSWEWVLQHLLWRRKNNSKLLPFTINTQLKYRGSWC